MPASESLASSPHDSLECLRLRRRKVTHHFLSDSLRLLRSPDPSPARLISSSSVLSGKRKWKKTCCVPSFILFTLVLGCLVTGMALLAVFKVDGENRTVNAVLIAIGSVVGLALLLNCRTWWQVTDSVLNSQRKRLHSAANRMHKLKSEGFMKVRRGHNLRGRRGGLLELRVFSFKVLNPLMSLMEENMRWEQGCSSGVFLVLDEPLNVIGWFCT